MCLPTNTTRMDRRQRDARGGTVAALCPPGAFLTPCTAIARAYL
jgi:hypothetical protein